MLEERKHKKLFYMSVWSNHMLLKNRFGRVYEEMKRFLIFEDIIYYTLYRT